MEKKIITFITVVKNDRLGLKRTLESVRGQWTPEVEHVVIDGSSTDGTVDLLMEYSWHGVNWFSELDGGIYNAMNKGLAKAQGKWICMLNAGDTLEESTIPKLLDFLKSCEESEIVVGDTYYYYPDLSLKRYVASDLRGLLAGMTLCHQSVFIPSVIYKRYGAYCENLICASDFEYLLKLRLSNERFIHAPFATTTYYNGGTSDRRFIRLRFEIITILWRLKSPRALAGSLARMYEVIQILAYNILRFSVGEDRSAKIRKMAMRGRR